MSPPATSVHVAPGSNGLASPASVALSFHAAAVLTRSTPKSARPPQPMARTAGVTWEARRNAMRFESLARSRASAVGPAARTIFAVPMPATPCASRAATMPAVSEPTISIVVQRLSVPATTAEMSAASMSSAVERKSTTGTNATFVAGPLGTVGDGSPDDTEPSDGIGLPVPPLGDPAMAAAELEGEPLPEGTTPGVAAGPPKTATASSTTTAMPATAARSGVGRRRTAHRL